MPVKSFISLTDDQVARNFYAALVSLINNGTFRDYFHAADRIGVTITTLLSWKAGHKVKPQILSVSARRFGIHPGWIHLGIEPMVVDRDKIFQVARALSI